MAYHDLKRFKEIFDERADLDRPAAERTQALKDLMFKGAKTVNKG